MPHVLSYFGLLALVLLSSGALTVARAKEAEAAVQAVIVFDVSGSMRQSDPSRLSVAAAQLFSNLSKPNDAIGLTAFSDRAIGIVPLTSGEGDHSRAPLQRSLATLQFNGQTTNLVAALEAGLAAFPEDDSSHRKLVLLLTDGRLDLGKNREDEEAAARKRIVESLIPEYRRRDIALYTIAFTTGADEAFLKQMAEASAGDSHFIENAQTLHEAFSQIFIGAHDSETFPLAQSSIQIDESIKELSLVFAKSTPGERISLLSPQRREVRAGATPEGTTWQSTPAYELVHMQSPEAGKWEIDRSGDVQSGVGIIAESTISLEVELGAAFIEVGQAISIRAFLEDEAQMPPTVKHEEGQAITAELTSPEGAKTSLTLAQRDDGSFSATTAPLTAAGKYSLLVSATTPTLQRQRTRTFDVHSECLHGSVSKVLPVKVQVVVDETCPTFKSLSLEAEYNAANGVKRRAVLRATQPGHFETDLPDAKEEAPASASVIVIGVTRDGGSFMLTKGPWPLPAAPKREPAASPPVPHVAAKSKHDVLVGAGRTLLQINVALLLVGTLGYATYWLYARLKKRGSWKKP